MIRPICLILSIFILLNNIIFGQNNFDSNKVNSQFWNLHFQQTIVIQGHGDFSALYSGENSLYNKSETKTSVTSTLFLGVCLWKGAELYFNPELSGGDGIGGTVGIAGFTNGEIYRVDNTNPQVNLARLFIKQTFNFKGKSEFVDDAANQLKSYQSNNRLTIVAGKISLTDYFDNNTYSHDARTQFLNWALMDNGAWDYAADTRGYTYGIYAENYKNTGAARFASVLVPKSANGLEMDSRIKDAYSLNFELEKSFSLFKRNCVIRFVYYRNVGHMGNYRLAIDDPSYNLNITQTRIYSRSKNGIGLDFEHELYKDAGIFARLGWNDGKNETWAFTEIDQTASAGILMSGSKWKRENDRAGLAFVVNGISSDHKEYLSKGGYGFIIGDGRLNYAPEFIVEAFYNIQIISFLNLTPDYQFVKNPAYNKDRGPVQVWSVRGHVEI